MGDADWPKLKKHFDDKISNLLLENHALRTVMLQELDAEELGALLHKPSGKRGLDVDGVRWELHSKPLPESLATQEIVGSLERCKEDAQIVSAENATLRSILLESVSEEDLKEFLPPPFGHGPAIPPPDLRAPDSSPPDSKPKPRLFAQGKPAAPQAALKPPTPEPAAPGLASRQDVQNRIQREVEAKMRREAEEEIRERTAAAMAASMPKDPEPALPKALPAPPSSFAPSSVAPSSGAPKTESLGSSLLQQKRLAIQQTKERHAMDRQAVNDRKCADMMSDFGVGLSSSQHANLMEERIRELTAELTRVSVESIQRGEMLNELNQYSELLELRTQQQEEEYAALQEQMASDAKAAEELLENERKQYERRLQNLSKQEEKEKKELVEFMEGERQDVETAAQEELQSEKERADELGKMLHEMQREWDEDAAAYKEKITQLKVQIAMSEASDVVDKIAGLQSTISVLQDQFTEEVMKRKKLENQLKAQEAMGGMLVNNNNKVLKDANNGVVNVPAQRGTGAALAFLDRN